MNNNQPWNARREESECGWKNNTKRSYVRSRVSLHNELSVASRDITKLLPIVVSADLVCLHPPAVQF